jgi:hypothetical protein
MLTVQTLVWNPQKREWNNVTAVLFPFWITQLIRLRSEFEAKMQLPLPDPSFLKAQEIN